MAPSLFLQQGGVIKSKLAEISYKEHRTGFSYIGPPYFIRERPVIKTTITTNVATTVTDMYETEVIEYKVDEQPTMTSVEREDHNAAARLAPSVSHVEIKYDTFDKQFLRAGQSRPNVDAFAKVVMEHQLVKYHVDAYHSAVGKIGSDLVRTEPGVEPRNILAEFFSGIYRLMDKDLKNNQYCPKIISPVEWKYSEESDRSFAGTPSLTPVVASVHTLHGIRDVGHWQSSVMFMDVRPESSNPPLVNKGKEKEPEPESEMPSKRKRKGSTSASTPSTSKRARTTPSGAEAKTGGPNSSTLPTIGEALSTTSPAGFGSVDPIKSNETFPRPVEDDAWMSKYAKEAMIALGNRRHVIGILVEGLELRFYYFDRAGSICTTQLHLVRDLERVVAAIININLLSLSEFGLQPLKGANPQSPIGQVDSILGSEVSVDGVRYEIAEPLHADPSLYGRGTVVWSAMRRPLQDELVREIILHDDKTTEDSRDAEERRRVSKRLKHERIPSGVVLKLSWQPIHKRPDDDLYAVVEERGIKNVAKLYGSRIAGRLSDGPRDGLVSTEWYQDRVLRVQVFGPIYQPISKIRETEVFKETFIGCVKAHHELYDMAKIIHRDVSPSNLMFERYGVGSIVDLEHAISIDGLSLRDDHNVPAPPTSAVGTPAFMSIDLHLDADSRPAQHYYRFDLESFFYSLAWLATHFHFGQQLYSTYFGEWVTGNDQEISNAKRRYMAACSDNSFQYNDATDVTETWLPALGKLFHQGYAARDAARMANQEFDDETLGGYVTYDKFMNILVSPSTADL